MSAGYCDVARCTVQQAHHHLLEDDGDARPCDGKSDDFDRYLSTCCELGPLLKPNPAAADDALIAAVNAEQEARAIKSKEINS